MTKKEEVLNKSNRHITKSKAQLDFEGFSMIHWQKWRFLGKRSQICLIKQ